MSTEDKPIILLVEDNDDNRRLVSKILGHHGYQVIEAIDGKKALKLLSTINPDLILMDINLPGMDGYEVTRQIRTLANFGNLPIVALTAHAMVGDKEKSLAAGCNAYITKPINVREFPKTISTIIKKH